MPGLSVELRVSEVKTRETLPEGVLLLLGSLEITLLPLQPLQDGSPSFGVRVCYQNEISLPAR